MFGGNKPFTFGTPTTSAGSVFGTSTFNTTTSGSGGLFGSTQQQPAANTGLFGQTSTSTAAPTFGTTFGTQSTGATMFGQPAAGNNTQLGGTTGNSMFGNANQPVFGATTQPSFVTANNQSAFGPKPLSFGAAKPLFGTATQPFGSTPQPTAFGASSAPTFGTQSSGTLFGTSNTAAPANQTMFSGGATNNPAQPANGSAIARFQPPMSTDTVMKNNQQQQVNVRHQHISAMREYETKSSEELRFEDYAAGRKGPQPGAAPTTGLFGAQSAAPASTGLFGSAAPQTATTGLFGATQNNTAAGNSSLFAKPATGLFGATPAANSTTGLFGTNTQAAGTNLFGQPAVQNQQTNSLFGTQPAAQTQPTNSLFGQPAVQNQNTTSLFGQTPAQTQPSLFGQPNTQAQTAGSLFGNTQPASGSLFGTPASQPNTSLFGAPSNTTAPTGGLFGQPAAQTQPTTSLFGNTAQPNTQQQTTTPFGGSSVFGAANKSLFGSTQPQPAASTTGGLFGSTTLQTQPASGNLFGTPQQNTASAGGSLFGSAQPQQSAAGSLFGSTQPQVQSNATATQPFGTATNPTTNQAGFGSLFANKTQTGAFNSPLLSTPQSTAATNSLFGKPLSTFGNTAQQPTGSLFGSTQPSAFSFNANTQPSANTSLFGNSNTTQSNVAGTLFGVSQPQPQTGLFNTQNTLFANQQQAGSLLLAAAAPAAASDAVVAQLQTQNNLLQQMVVALSAQAPYGNNSVLSSLVERSRTGEAPPQRPLVDAAKQPPLNASEQDKTAALLQSLIQDDRRTLLSRPTSFLAQRNTLSTLFNRTAPQPAYGGLLRSVSAQLSAPPSGKLFAEPISSVRSFADRHQEQSSSSRSFAGRATGGWLDELDAPAGSNSTRFATRRQLKQLVIRPPAPSLSATTWNLRSPMPSSGTPLRREEEEDEEEDEDEQYYRSQRSDRAQVLRRRSDGEQLRRTEERRSGPPTLDAGSHTGPSPFRTPDRPVAKSSAVPKRLTFDSPEVESPSAMSPSSPPPASSLGPRPATADNDRCKPDAVTPKRERDTRDDSMLSRRGDQDGVVSSSQLHPARIVLTNPDYYTRPSLAELARRTDENGDCLINELVVGRTGYGEVHFAHRDAVALSKASKSKSDSRPTSPAPNAGPRPGWFNIAGVNLDETVVIERKAVTVYPNDDEKPPIGEGLNRPARVTLLGIFPRDKVTREPIRDAARIERLRYAERIAVATQEIGAHFVRYTSADGAWTFDVSHFSKYGLAPDDDDDDTTAVAAGSLPAKNATTTAKPADTTGNKPASRSDQPADESVREHKVDKQVLRLEGSTVAVRDGDDLASPSSNYVPAVVASSVKASSSASLSLALLSSQRVHASTTQTPLVSQFRRSTAAGRSFLDLDAVDDRRAQATCVADLERDAVLLLSELEQTPHRLTRPAAEDSKLTKTAPPAASDKGDKKLLNLEQLEAAASLMTGARFDNVTRLFAPFPGLGSSLLDGLSRNRCWHAALRANGPAGDRVLPVARRFRVRFGPSWTVVLPARPEQLPVSNATRKRPFVNGLAVGRLLAATTDDSARFVAQCEALLNVALNACVFERDAHSGSPFARPNPSAMDDMLSAYSRLLEADVDSDVQQETDAEPIACMFDTKVVREVRAALRLFASLFGSVPSDLVSYNRNFSTEPSRDGRSEAAEYTESQTRKELVTRWLETELRLHSGAKRPSEAAETRTNKQNAHIGAVFERLVEHRVDEAATICADSGDLRLALLIAQVGRNGAAPRRVRELIDEQLAVWTVDLSGCTRFIDPARLKLFHLLAGRMISVGYTPTTTASDTKMNTSTTLLPTSSVKVNVCDTLDWLQAFGMHLWYANVPSAGLEHVLRTFDRAWKPLLGTRSAAYCKPPTKRIRNEVSKTRTVKSVCYHLLKLYTKRSHHLEKLLMPEAMLPGTDCIPDFSSLCDARFSWVLWQLLQSAGFTHLPVAAQIRLHTSLAAQLESAGMWDWAAFVLSHVPHSASRQFSIRALLLRNVSISRVEMQLELDRSTAEIDDSTENSKEKPAFPQDELDAFASQKERESFLCDRIGVAREWLDEAKAARARSERAFELAAFYALRHADFAAAHRTLLDDLLPDLLLSDQYDRIDTLLDYFEHVFIATTARRSPLDVGSSSLLGEYSGLPDWYTNGARVYRDLVQLVQSASSTVEQLRTAARDGDLAELVRFVNDLQQRVISLCVRLRTFRTGNNQQTLAKVEFIRVLNTILNTVRRKMLPTVPLCERAFAVPATDSDEATRIDSSLLDFSAAKCELLELSGPLAIVELDC